MSPATIAPFNGRGRGKLFLSAAALIAVAAFVGLRDASLAPAPVTQATAVSPGADIAPSDTHLASLQSAFAMSHVGALRDDADVEDKPAPKARATASRPPVAPRAVASPPVAQAPLPPVIPALPQVAEPVQPESKPSSLFGFVPALPSPGKLVERVSSIGESITSLVRWR